MTLRELAILQSEKRWGRFSYLTENQPGYDENPPFMNFSIPFPEMIIRENPNTIFFKLGKSPWIAGFNGMTLHGVRKIDIEPCILGDILKIRCTDGKTYIIIAD